MSANRLSVLEGEVQSPHTRTCDPKMEQVNRCKYREAARRKKWLVSATTFDLASVPNAKTSKNKEVPGNLSSRKNPASTGAELALALSWTYTLTLIGLVLVGVEKKCSSLGALLAS